MEEGASAQVRITDLEHAGMSARFHSKASWLSSHIRSTYLGAISSQTQRHRCDFRKTNTAHCCSNSQGLRKAASEDEALERIQYKDARSWRGCCSSRLKCCARPYRSLLFPFLMSCGSFMTENCPALALSLQIPKPKNHSNHKVQQRGTAWPASRSEARKQKAISIPKTFSGGLRALPISDAVQIKANLPQFNTNLLQLVTEAQNEPKPSRWFLGATCTDFYTIAVDFEGALSYNSKSQFSEWYGSHETELEHSVFLSRVLQKGFCCT